MNDQQTPSQSLPPLALYIHIPWCLKKCPYCDFNSHVQRDTREETYYIEALLEDLRCDLETFEICRPIQTIFIGGGTPSLFSPQSIERLLTGVDKLVKLSSACEITLEANPGTFDSSKFGAFHRIGINRLSIGIQSFNDRYLLALGRVHDGNEALRAVEIARQSGFENINLDLMFGLPNQTQFDARKDVELAIGLIPNHLSYYQLTLEPNTWFHKFPPPLPPDDDIFQIQQSGQQLLTDHGYLQYEISAYARNDQCCRHNLNYWQFGDYLGIGAGAHGKISRSLPKQIIRTMKCKNPDQYLKQKDRSVKHVIAVDQLPLEFVMNHLRLKNGFTMERFYSTTGLSIDTLKPALSKCIDEGLLIKEGGYYRCSDKGWNFVDNILEHFLVGV